ncbi:MAG TPA: DUF1501 domain-containing protein [Planctomycetota bacterium]|nr:DUF1501 domain-containing protein [Planctomycetota bacterium]
MERREFLKMTACGMAASALPGTTSLLFAQDKKKKGADTTPRTLVVIYLRGGMDAINALVPYGDKSYAEIRPTIGVPEKDAEQAPGILKLDDVFGFHPSLKPLMPFWESKKLAPIINAGSPHGTRSHFDAQDFMEYAAPGVRTLKEGWLNRYLRVTKAKAKEEKGEKFNLRAVAMQGLLPRALRGDVAVLAVPERYILNNDKLLDSYKDLYGEQPPGMEGQRTKQDPAVAMGRDTLETLEQYKDLIQKQRGEKKERYPGGYLGAKLQDVATLIHAEAGLEIAAVDVQGWDHHANEGGSTGTLANMLKDLGGAVAAFATDLGDKLDRTLVLVMTEFGRTCRENGNNGTDHGHGGLMLLLGGALQGGKVHGKWSGLAEKSLYEGRDLPASTDFRDVFADALRHHMRCDLPKDFFPDYQPKEIKGLF